MRIGWVWFLLLLSTPSSGHEVRIETGTAPVTIVTLRYADGEAFAYEQFEVRISGSSTPIQTGRTDAQGRAAILPVPGKALEFLATSRDGHGATLRIAGLEEQVSPSPAAELPRWLAVAAGAGVLFGLFGLLQLFGRRR